MSFTNRLSSAEHSCGRELCEWPCRANGGLRQRCRSDFEDLLRTRPSAKDEQYPRMTSWEGNVPQLFALSLSIAVLGAVWAYLALGPLAGFVLVWAGFIA